MDEFYNKYLEENKGDTNDRFNNEKNGAKDCGWIDNKGNIHKDDDIDFSLEYYCKLQMKYYRIK